MQDDMRERLIELIKKVPYGVSVGATFERHFCEKVADHLIANGVILPPCYIGQPVWEVYKWFTGKVEVREGKISMLQQKADKTWKIRVSINSSVYDITVDKIGKTIFLSREEAEKRQEELKND